eukprot:5607882-Amphidinium_carterae.1
MYEGTTSKGCSNVQGKHVIFNNLNKHVIAVLACTLQSVRTVLCLTLWFSRNVVAANGRNNLLPAEERFLESLSQWLTNERDCIRRETEDL